MKHLWLTFVAIFGLTQNVNAAPQSYLWQTNASGNNVHIYNLNNFKLHKDLLVGEQPHGIAAPDDVHVIYISLENDAGDNGELLWVDPIRLRITHRIAVGPQPHAIATTPDGQWIYVPCRDGNYWVINGFTKKVVKKIYTGGRPHNTQASRDGRLMLLSPMGGPNGVTVVDIQAQHKVVGFIPYGNSVRPSALSADAKFLFQHIDGLNGFEVADVAKRQVVANIEHSTNLGWFRPIESIGYITLDGLKRCHGLAITPNQQEIWSICAENLVIHNFDSPTFSEKQLITLPSKGYWLTFSADNKYAFVALADQDMVAVFDVATKKIIHQLAAGKSPKRNLVISY